MSASHPPSANDSLVHIPSTMASWEMDSASDSDAGPSSEHVEEIEEICTPYREDSPYGSLPPGCSASRRRSLLPPNGHGDDLPGAKARKVMGMSMESQFVDSDDDEDSDSSSSHSSLARSLSLRNPFKRSGSAMGHRRGASLDMEMGNSKQKSTARPRTSGSAVKRRPSLSDMFGLPASRSGSSSSSSPADGLPIEIPSRSSSSLSIRRPIQAVFHKETGPAMKKRVDLSERSQIEEEWSTKLVEAAREAEWQTAIEHRPKQPSQHHPIKVESHRHVLYPAPVPSNNSNEAIASPAADCVDPSLSQRSVEAGPQPSLSPALSGRLEQIAASKSTHHRQHGRSISIDSVFQPVTFAAVPPQRRPSLPTSSSAPPRPPRSSKREVWREAEVLTAAAPTPTPAPAPEEVEESILGSQLIEYIDGCDVDVPADDYFGGAEESNSPACSSAGRSSISRYSGSSLTFSDEALLNNTTSSPGLSSSTTSASVTSKTESARLLGVADERHAFHNSIDVIAQADEIDRPISPFMCPRKAPDPPIFTDLATVLREKSSRKAARPLLPPLVRQDSAVDPDYLNGGVAPSPCGDLHQQERPLSVPFSPTSAHTDGLDLEEDMGDEAREEKEEDEEEREDEFLSALDKLGSHLQLSHALTLGQGYGEESPLDKSFGADHPHIGSNLHQSQQAQIDSSCPSSRQCEDNADRASRWSSDRTALHFLRLYSSS